MVPRSPNNDCLMEAIRQSTMPAQRLSQLYSDTKQSYTATNNAPQNAATNLSQAKFELQKHRLTTWGIGWADESSASNLSIDESVEKAGLTDVVSSVLESIQGLLTDVGKLKPQRSTSYSSPVEKSQSADLTWSDADKAKYEELVKDLTSAIDVLYDLTKWRRTASAEPRESSDTKFPTRSATSDSKASIPISRKAVPRRTESFNSIPEKAPLHATAKLDISTLVLPEEEPPPYHSINTVISPRALGYAQRRSPISVGAQGDHSIINVPVLVEYANYHPDYKINGSAPPLSRLDELLHAFYSPGHLASSDSLLPMAGYFEDPNHSRFGLVYELPASAYLTTVEQSINSIKPTSLLSLLQGSAKSKGGIGSIPPLEQRFRLALELARVFSLLQENGISHRDVSSSNVIFFSKSNETGSSTSSANPSYDLRKPFMCSFDLFSERTNSGAASENLYRHPDDPRVNGNSTMEKSAFQFDVYGLGLLLLEIGLWTPLSEFYKPKYSLDDFRQRLRLMRMRRVADRCGSAYVRIVEACLDAGSAGSNTSPGQICVSIVPRLRRLCLSHDEFLPSDDFDYYLPKLPKLSEAENSWQPQEQQDYYTTADSLPNISESPVALTPVDSKSKHTNIILQSDDLNDSKEGLHSLSTSKSLRKKRFEYPAMEIPPTVLKQWEDLGTRLTSIVNHALRNSTESSSIGLTCSGENEESAKPTFVITCSSTRLVRAALRRKFQYDKNLFDLAVIKGNIVRSKAAANRGRRPRRSAFNSSSTCSTEPLNPSYQVKPLCGASIGAFKDNEHLPPVSYGGVVMIDGEPYGMSVHHLIEDPEDEDEDDQGFDLPIRSSAAAPSYAWGAPAGFNSGLDDGGISDDFTGMGFGTDVSGAYPRMIEIDEEDYDSDEEPEDMIDDTSDDEDDEDESVAEDEGDRDGIAKGEGEEIVITQPALEDVDEGFFPSLEDRDDDHLDSHTLGHVHASSGIRRLDRGGVKHEIDWALIKLKDDRLQPQNLVAGGKRFCPSVGNTAEAPGLVEPICRGIYEPGEDLYPHGIANSEHIANMAVHCFGRTSGLQGGKISRTMDFVKFPGRKSFSKSWYVVGNFGIGGDSGAWVIDNKDGSICGHVLAWSASLSRAYISPMDVMFEDIGRTLGANDVSLPGGDKSSIKPDCQPSKTAASTAVRAHGSTAREMAVETGISQLALSRDSTPQYQRAGKETARVNVRETPTNLLAHHLLMSGAPDHMEREWTSRRRALGKSLSQKIPG